MPREKKKIESTSENSMQDVHTAPSPSSPSTHPSPGHHEKLINLPVCERVVWVPDLHLHLLLVPIIGFPWGTGRWQHQGQGKEGKYLDTTVPRSSLSPARILSALSTLRLLPTVPNCPSQVPRVPSHQGGRRES